MKLPKNCSHCSSDKIKVSSSYPDMYFCSDCKDGGPLIPDHQPQASGRLYRHNSGPGKTFLYPHQLDILEKHKKLREKIFIPITKNMGKTLFKS